MLSTGSRRGLVGSFSEVDSGISLGHNHILEVPEHVACFWCGNSHQPHFAEDNVPLIHDGAPLGIGDDVKDLPQPLDAVGRQVYCHAEGVHNPD